MTVRPLVVAAVAAAAVFTTAAPAIQTGNTAGRPALEIASAYLSPPVTVGDRSIRGVVFRGEITDTGGSGTLILDPNGCSLNEFGDRVECSLIGFPDRKVTLARVRVDDPLKQGRRLYSVTGEKVPAKTTLVTPGGAGGDYRLLIDSGNGPALVTLTASPKVEKKDRKE